VYQKTFYPFVLQKSVYVYNFTMIQILDTGVIYKNSSPHLTELQDFLTPPLKNGDLGGFQKEG